MEKYIQELIEWIESNIKEIELPYKADFFKDKCCCSLVTLNREFKKFMGMTLRDYVIVRKLILISELQKQYGDISYDELMTMANYHYPAQTFRNQKKKYKSKIEKIEDCRGLDIYLFRNMSVFSEIMVRLNLYLNLSKPQIKDESFMIHQYVENTIFQLGGLLAVEKFHDYVVYLNLSDISFSFDGPWVTSSFDEKGHCRFYKDISIYFCFLATINKRLQECLGFSLTEIICNWDGYVKSLEEISFLGREVLRLEVDLSSKPILEIDRNSSFMLATNEMMDDIKEKLFKKCKNSIKRNYSVTYETILRYAQAVESVNYDEMVNILDSVNLVKNRSAIDLFLELTQTPCVDNYLLEGISSVFDQGIMQELNNSSHNEIICCIIQLKKQVELLFEKEGDYYDFDFNEWYRKMIGKK